MVFSWAFREQEYVLPETKMSFSYFAGRQIFRLENEAVA